MIEILYKGFIIGILASAPMGPIALLCIQRTLSKGRWHGFFSGVGAALADVIYATITCLGMGLVIDFIKDNETIIFLIGSILLIPFGYYIYRSDPSKNLIKTREGASTYHQDTVTSFFLTLSNPLIIVLFIALFARFNFISPDEKLFSMIIGLCSIAIGALTWWFLITFLIGKLRKNFNIRGLWIMNRIVGISILLFSVGGIIYCIWKMNSITI